MYQNCLEHLHNPISLPFSLKALLNETLAKPPAEQLFNLKQILGARKLFTDAADSSLISHLSVIYFSGE